MDRVTRAQGERAPRRQPRAHRFDVVLAISARAPALVLVRKRLLADGRLAEVVRVTMNPEFYEFHATDSEQAASRLALQARAA